MSPPTTIHLTDLIIPSSSSHVQQLLHQKFIHKGFTLFLHNREEYIKSIPKSRRMRYMRQQEYFPIEFFQDEEIVVKVGQPFVEHHYAFEAKYEAPDSFKEYVNNYHLENSNIVVQQEVKIEKEEKIEKPKKIKKNLMCVLTNKEEALKIVENNGKHLYRVCDELKNDKEVVWKAIQQNICAIQFASQELRNDLELATFTIAKNGLLLKWLSTELRNDKNLVLLAVTTNGNAFQYASRKLQHDKEIVIAAITNCRSAYNQVPQSLKKDSQVMKVLFKEIDYSKIDFKLAKKLCSRKNIFAFLSDELRNDKKMVQIAAQQYASSIQFASPELKNDKDFIFHLLQGNALILSYLPELQKDKEFMMRAVSICGVFRYASYSLTADKHVVAQACSYHHSAIGCAASTLLDDSEFILDLLSLNPLVYNNYRMGRYRRDDEFTKKAMERTGMVYSYRLVKDPQEFSKLLDLVLERKYYGCSIPKRYLGLEELRKKSIN
ncbi:hypothetical protein C9374_002149 [Naegleria lovaniensis]|uniref:DUF4116 domain-containing protein n=1 Tax=Naegleria lovaniensis TaxID=51637 RepID=A0AA88KMM6_NAELO|nr:uncharacterized protein C9374_002149 [Naegleria lovaniensis]KAG2387114.1 hypothetical protein C9374_002149 [Naegleria lovaniensis]